MKIITLALAAMLLGGAAHAQNIRDREARQQHRIGHGVRSGQLTPGETRKLERNEARLHRQIRRDRVDGGGLSAAERSRIARQQNRMSNRIFRLKKNNRTF